MATQAQAYVPIQGVEYSIIPEVSLRGKNLFEVQLYAQDNGLVVLPSTDVNRVAKAVQRDKPNGDFIRYARDHTDLNEKDVNDAYRQLHDGIWQRYRVRAREILMWVPSSPTMHPRLVSDKSPASEVVSVLLKDYKVVGRDKLDIRGISPDPRFRVNWPTSYQKITKELSQLLGAPDNTDVWTYPNTQDYEGLRALYWDFRGRERPVLYSLGGPWLRFSDWGSLLGRGPQTKQ